MSQIVVHITNPGALQQTALDAAIAWGSNEDTLCLFHNPYHARISASAGDPDVVLEETRALLMARRRTQLDALAVRIQDQTEGKVDVALIWERSSWQSLIRVAKERRADLVVAEAQQQSRWRRLALGQEDWELIRHCPGSLLLARENSRRPYRKIVAAVDPLHDDDKPAELDNIILRLAVALAQRHAGKVDVLNLVAPTLAVPPSLTEPMITADLAAQQYSVARHHDAVDELTAPHAEMISAQIVRVGEPAEQIVDYVTQHQADLLVMGAIARSALKRMLVGSTAEQVLDRVPCDVLVAKPARFDPGLPGLASLLPIDY